MIGKFYWLAKPGIIYGNLLSTVAGFVLASKSNFHIPLFLATVFGISFVMGCACVLNNYLDRGIDVKMNRTRNRASVTGEIPLVTGLIYAVILGLIGFGLLLLYTNSITVWVAFAGVVVYVPIYGYFKRASSFGTIVGSFAGAVPPLVGYLAVTNKFDAAAWLLLVILGVWQMPHFYAIAIYRKEDYAQAGIPVLPLTAGVRNTKIAILLCIIIFIVASELLYFYHYTGLVYAVIMAVLGIWWLIYGFRGFGNPNEVSYGRKMFMRSLVALLVLNLGICIGVFLP